MILFYGISILTKLRQRSLINDIQKWETEE